MSISKSDNSGSRHNEWLEMVEAVYQAREKYLRRFPTEAHSMDAICSGIIKAGCIQCPCGSRNVERKFGERDCTCSLCGKKLSVTAGTFFARMRMAQPWHFCIWMMERGIVCNAHIFHIVTTISYSTAWGIFRKIAMVIENKMAESKKLFPVDSTIFMALFAKRSRITTANMPPDSEQREAEEEWFKKQTNSAPPCGTTSGAGLMVPVVNLTADEQMVYDLLTSRPTSFDALLMATHLDFSPLSMILLTLELAGLIERIVTGHYVLMPPKIPNPQSGLLQPITPWLEYYIKALIELIGQIHRGVSRKYLQAYLAYYWAIFDKQTWKRNAISQACAKAKPISSMEIRAYRTALFVNLVHA